VHRAYPVGDDDGNRVPEGYQQRDHVRFANKRDDHIGPAGADGSAQDPKPLGIPAQRAETATVNAVDAEWMPFDAGMQL
jgi:hypothetical protein